MYVHTILDMAYSLSIVLSPEDLPFLRINKLTLSLVFATFTELAPSHKEISATLAKASKHSYLRFPQLIAPHIRMSLSLNYCWTWCFIGTGFSFMGKRLYFKTGNSEGSTFAFSGLASQEGHLNKGALH